MSNNLGLFNWIREGVRQSVLMGVSDALETIGTPESNGKLHPALLSFSNNAGANNLVETDAGPVKKIQSTAAPRKRLGRSLKDIEPNKPAS